MHLLRAGGKIVLLNPFNALRLPSHGFNPVAALDPDSDDFPDDALGLAEALIRVQGQEPHWSESAQDLLAALVMYARLTQADGGSLGFVRAQLGRPAAEFRQLVEEMMIAGIEHDCEELTVKSGRFREINTDIAPTPRRSTPAHTCPFLLHPPHSHYHKAIAKAREHGFRGSGRKFPVVRERRRPPWRGGVGDRKRDTRRKIIVGAAVLAHAELHPAVANQLRAILDKAVTRDLDRQAIADLLPAGSANAGAAAGAAAKPEKAA